MSWALTSGRPSAERRVTTALPSAAAPTATAPRTVKTRASTDDHPARSTRRIAQMSSVRFSRVLAHSVSAEPRSPRRVTATAAKAKIAVTAASTAAFAPSDSVPQDTDTKMIAATSRHRPPRPSTMAAPLAAGNRLLLATAGAG